MSFENHFYTVNSEELEQGSAVFALSINSQHEVFKGHFPDNPVTPGVMQMEMVKELLSKVEKREMSLVSMGNCKFLKVLDPVKSPEVTLSMNYAKQEDGQYKVSTQIKDESGIYLKMSAYYQ